MTSPFEGAGLPQSGGRPDRIPPCSPAPTSHRASPPGTSTRHRVTKAVLDRLGAGVLLLIAAPWLAVITLAVVIESPGPVLCRSRRVGQWGREFDLLRFRTSVDGPGQPTRLGRLLRRFSLDELPQLINVVLGRMSLVGPRPQPLPVPGPGADAAPPLSVKPGLTGLWHLGASPRWDLDRPVGVSDYAQGWSLAVDLGILWRAICSVMRSGGAL
jgi:lipopolysaccharide/colanic/teichoic acid biosynthesis glycosyltransferase